MGQMHNGFDPAKNPTNSATAKAKKKKNAKSRIVTSDTVICRICHKTAEESGKPLVWLGCGCKSDLRFAHSHCQQAWFSVKEKRSCKSVGKTVTSIRTCEVCCKIIRNVRVCTNVNPSVEESSADNVYTWLTLCFFVVVILAIVFVPFIVR